MKQDIQRENKAKHKSSSQIPSHDSFQDQIHGSNSDDVNKIIFKINLRCQVQINLQISDKAFGSNTDKQKKKPGN